METNTYNKYKMLIKNYIQSTYKLMFREPDGIIKYPFIVPGSVYSSEVWDWDSFFTNIALRQIIADGEEANVNIIEYEKGCVLNFLEHTAEDGYVPIRIRPNTIHFFSDAERYDNMHKPCLAQHIAFIMQFDDTAWVEAYFERLELFIEAYKRDFQHVNGLYFWKSDLAIGVDNDPCTFYRPEGSSASIYLNALMYKELNAMEYICRKLGFEERAKYYFDEKNRLKDTINEKLWDEKDGFYYSADLNLLPINPQMVLHSGAPRDWDFLIQRIGVWSGMMPLWAGIATKEQAKRVIEENYKDEKGLFAPYGIRTLSMYEKMYKVAPQGNPSCWLGPVWGISNYLTFKALLAYGYEEEAKAIALKSVELYGKDIEKCGAMHEYYHPDTGEGIYNKGFQNWNFLVLNMIAYLDGREMISEI